MYDRIVDHSLIPRDASRSGDRWTQVGASSSVDQMQIALAIADETLLKTLLTDSTRPIVPLHQIGHVSSTIGVRVSSGEIVDAVLTYEHVRCIPADGEADIDPFIPCINKSATECQREIAHLTRCESDLQTLVHHTPLAETLAVLTQSGFSPNQIRTILHLPQDAWYKTWWYALDDQGEFTTPFHRRIRSRQYTDGAITIQYVDQFPMTKPPCFRSLIQRVVVSIHREDQSFSHTLATVNASREQLGTDQAILLCDRLSELEARGYLSQHVSLYTASELAIPSHADCMICVNADCPMNRRIDSPVTTCRNFCVGDWS